MRDPHLCPGFSIEPFLVVVLFCVDLTESLDLDLVESLWFDFAESFWRLEGAPFTWSGVLSVYRSRRSRARSRRELISPSFPPLP